jgi:hypothetical protein
MKKRQPFNYEYGKIIHKQGVHRVRGFHRESKGPGLDTLIRVKSRGLSQEVK